MGLHVIIVDDGLSVRVFGPFKTEGAAEEYAGKHFAGYEVVPLEAAE